MLMFLKIYGSYRGAYLAKNAIFGPLPFSYFFSYIHTLYLKRTHFHANLIVKKNIDSLMSKNQSFLVQDTSSDSLEKV